MRILIVGGGKTGAYLAQRFHGMHEVTVIEKRPDKASLLGQRYPDIRVIRGVGDEPNVLERAGITDIDLVAAMTGDDEDNLVVSLLSKQTFAVPLVFARVNHPANEWLFTRNWGVDVAVSTAGVVEGLVQKEVLLGDVSTLLRLQAEDLVIGQLTLTQDAAAVGRSISDLDLPEGTRVIAIISAGQVRVPGGSTVLAGGDELLILARSDMEAELSAKFGVSPEPR